MASRTAPTKPTILLSVAPTMRRRVSPALRQKLRRRARRIVEAVGLQGVELSVLLTDNTEIAELNQTYRKKHLANLIEKDRHLFENWAKNSFRKLSPNKSDDAKIKINRFYWFGQHGNSQPGKAGIEG